MKTSCIIFFAFLSSLGLFAQEDFFSTPAYYQNRASLNIIPEIEIGFAINEFQEKMDKGVLLGKGISIFYRLKNRPIDIGLRFGDFSYDHVKRIYDGNRQKTKNKIWNWYSVFRFEPITKLPFQPYFEGSLGLNHYKTKTYTKQIGAQLLALIFNSDESVRFDEANLHSDWATNYGGAIGCYFYLIKIIIQLLMFKLDTVLETQLSFMLKEGSRFKRSLLIIMKKEKVLCLWFH